MSVLTLTEDASGSAVTVHVGDAIVLRLPENPTTGYRWQIDKVEGSAQHESDSFRLSEDVRIGSGGTREFRFRAASAGTASLRLKRWQPWEGETSVDARFVVDIVIA